MKLGSLAYVIALASIGATSPTEKAPAPVEVHRIDCGRIWVPDLNAYSDTQAYTGLSRELVSSCYLIRHGPTLMLWESGLASELRGRALSRGREDEATFSSPISEQLTAAGVNPANVSIIAISHYHFDHTGQARDFPHARLLMSAEDLKALRVSDAARATPLAHWLGGGGSVEEVSGDRDVFGDGTVTMIDLPGHTPGHHGLLVRPTGGKPLLLSGDVAHFRENLRTNGVTTFNDDRARSLASMDRFRKLARKLRATIVIQHDSRDVAKVRALTPGR